jgi:predicted MPP superfamily phosphohydrolase
MAPFPAWLTAAATIEIEAIHMNYGGSFEYVAAVLLVLQMLVARSYLSKQRAIWPRPVWLAVTAMLVLLWVITVAALYIVLFGVMYSSRAFPVVLGAVLAAAGYFWILVSSVATVVIVIARVVLAGIPGMHPSSRRRVLRTVTVAAVGAPVAASAFGMFIERNQYGIRELDLPVPDLHPDLEGFRIVQVSDLHVSPFLSARSAGQVIDMANGLHPDLAVFTGDLITEMGDPLDDAIRELIRLRADRGVLGCMGNHEEYVGCRNYLQRQAARAGITFLRHAATQIHRGNATLNIVGVDYQRSTNRENYLPHLERLVIPGATNLLLSHNPDVFPTALRRGFQAVLSGHTHGGQVNVEILHQNINPARFRTPYTSGLYQLGAADEAQASCFVTNGVGTIGMPVRLGAPPEIALLRLRRA